MVTKIFTERIGDRIMVKSAYHMIEFDSRLADKKYPFAIGLHNEKLKEWILAELESSKIIKIDTDLCYYSERLHASTIYIVPQPLFDSKKFTEIIYTLMQKLADEIESI
ncbi:hypothetical protein JGH11_10565 [Dysgonomonas sp. Marseille-P4677]|uniref:hypothetical protein n=1 Tax=Dysgonomonas sp. Marseille-P4677 TaxID=2364790 RepID=UPI001914BD02|nr:hypothetical protein [Dysgonomonas sp. Marseille-P4677]MBK5721314.1 hypothetical protein [Dysgonomonas sp. Marseille-P4677]